MRDDWVLVFESERLQDAADRALVLHARAIPYEVLRDGSRAALAVPAEFDERARYEIWQYEQENRRPRTRPGEFRFQYRDGLPGVVAYVLVICLAAWLAGESAFGRDWFANGRVDGALIRQGEWWRLFAALTLHSGPRHLIGNLGFGIAFGFLAGRLAGSGVAWFGIVCAAAAANAFNTLFLDSAHRSIGASTAVFAALGLVAGYVWRSRLMVQDRWAYRLGPIVGGIALLAFTGTGDESTDVGAHLLGFVCGFGTGLLLTRLPDRAFSPRIQLLCGIIALALPALAWLAAFAG
jgi:membrane associated rhomboid family serine protease